MMGFSQKATLLEYLSLLFKYTVNNRAWKCDSRCPGHRSTHLTTKRTQNSNNWKLFSLFHKVSHSRLFVTEHTAEVRILSMFEESLPDSKAGDNSSKWFTLKAAPQDNSIGQQDTETELEHCDCDCTRSSVLFSIVRHLNCCCMLHTELPIHQASFPEILSRVLRVFHSLRLKLAEDKEKCTTYEYVPSEMFSCTGKSNSEIGFQCSLKQPVRTH